MSSRIIVSMGRIDSRIELDMRAAVDLENQLKRKGLSAITLYIGDYEGDRVRLGAVLAKIAQNESAMQVPIAVLFLEKIAKRNGEIAGYLDFIRGAKNLTIFVPDTGCCAKGNKEISSAVSAEWRTSALAFAGAHASGYGSTNPYHQAVGVPK